MPFASEYPCFTCRQAQCVCDFSAMRARVFQLETIVCRQCPGLRLVCVNDLNTHVERDHQVVGDPVRPLALQNGMRRPMVDVSMVFTSGQSGTVQ